jgi:glycosyltransferase involved in cell wall biosynthesis
LPLSLLYYLADAELDRGGIVRTVLDVAAAMAARGHRVGLATCSPVDIPDGWSASQPSGSVPSVIPLQRAVGGIRFTHRSVVRLRELLPAYDVVHFNNLWNPELVHFARLAREAQKPYVVTPHGTLDPWSMGQRRGKKRAYLALAGGRLLRGAAALHFTAAVEQSSAEQWVTPQASAVIPNVVDLEAFFPGAAGDDSCAGGGSPPTLLFLSRLHPKKRPELLISAVAVLRDTDVAVQVAIAGSGEASYVAGLQDLVAGLSLGDRIRFLGTVGGQAKIDLYRSADLFVVPTSQENFGIVFVEALASALPVVATTGTDIWPELSGTGGAVICDLDREPQPAVKLAEVIAELLADPARRRSMAEAGRAGVQEWLDTDRTCAALAAFYQGAIDRSTERYGV